MTREITLPADAVDLLAGRSPAGRIAADLHAAFWMHGHSDHAVLHLLRQVHDNFAELAADLGYTITPIEQTEVTE